MKILEAILDLLFPPRCTFCHRLTQGGASICPRCMERLPYTGNAAQQSFPHLDGCCSPLYYEGSVRDSLLRYKFGGLKLYAVVYGHFLAKCVDENAFSCDSITWVPLSSRRLRRRGYDQARLLAEDLARELGLPCSCLLRKKKNNPAQSRTGNAEKRRRNVKGAYESLEGADIAGRRILLVDDIVTTGATLSECASVLKSAGAEAVYGCTVARRRD